MLLIVIISALTLSISALYLQLRQLIIIMLLELQNLRSYARCSSIYSLRLIVVDTYPTIRQLDVRLRVAIQLPFRLFTNTLRLARVKSITTLTSSYLIRQSPSTVSILTSSIRVAINLYYLLYYASPVIILVSILPKSLLIRSYLLALPQTKLATLLLTMLLIIIRALRRLVSALTLTLASARSVTPVML